MPAASPSTLDPGLDPRAETVAREKGLTGATIEAIKASILGVKA